MKRTCVAATDFDELAGSRIENQLGLTIGPTAIPEHKKHKMHKAFAHFVLFVFLLDLTALQLGDDCRPEFFKEIRAELAGETHRRSRQRAANGALALHTPGVGEKVVSDVARISRISGMELPITAACSEGQIRRMRDASPEGSVG